MADEVAMDEYNQALDQLDDVELGPEEEGDIPTMTPAEAIALTQPPSAQTQGLLEQHPEIYPDYEDAIQERLQIQGTYPPFSSSSSSSSEEGGNDTKHTTYPFLTLYERTKVLSLRASQLAHGAPPFIEVPEFLTDVYDIAKAELEAKRLPYIMKRPLPDGTYEYWRLADLMIL
jgi:DNA-directed RNA polymerases I, II, and III subunit RPABC2